MFASHAYFTPFEHMVMAKSDEVQASRRGGSLLKGGTGEEGNEEEGRAPPPQSPHSAERHHAGKFELMLACYILRDHAVVRLTPVRQVEAAGAQGCSGSQLADGSLPLHRHLSTFPPPRHAVQVLGFFHDRFVQVFMWLKMEGNHENFSPGLG